MAADQNLNQVLRDLHAADNTNTGDPPDDIDYFNHTFTETTTYLMQTLTGEQFAALRRFPQAGYTYVDDFRVCPFDCRPYRGQQNCQSCCQPTSIRIRVIFWFPSSSDIHANHANYQSS